MTNEFSVNEIDKINGSTDLYDSFAPIIRDKIKDSRTTQKLLQLTRAFMSKNEHSLATNIIGRRVLVNQKMEDDIYDAFGLDKDEIKKVMLNSGYFKGTFGKELSLTNQLCLAVPLILGAIEYKLIGKKDESELCYLLAHFKPYSSRESLFFKYPVKESQMLYTVEKTLSERFDLKKYGTIINAIQKRAASSYDNYIEPVKAGDKFSDKRLYVAYTSGIASSMNNFIGGIVELYRKNEGKSLDYESSVNSFEDEEGTDYDDSDIQSDTAIKANIVNKTLLKLTKNPVDKKLAILACQSGFNGSTSNLSVLTTTLESIIDHMFDDLEPFFNALISSFLFHDKPGGGKYTMADFKSPLFIRVGLDILAGKKQNVKDVNLVRCRDIMRKMCEEYCDKFILDDWKETSKRNFKTALASYWVFLIKSTN